MKRKESPGVSAILDELKREIRLRGVPIADLAAQLDVSEPTMWRWLRGRGLSLDNLDRLCLILNLDIRDLVSRSASQGADRFTLAQERVLAADRGLALLFFLILNGAQVAECTAELEIGEERLAADIERLRRLGLVDLAKTGRLRALTSRGVRWRSGGPLDQAFDRTIKPLFLERPLGEGDARYVSDMVRLSAGGRARVLDLFEALRVDIHLIARQEQDMHVPDREWSALFLLTRPFDMNAVREGLG